MSHRPVNIDVTEAAITRFDTAIQWMMLALLAFMPAALGAVEGWSHLVVVVLVGAMGLCLALRQLLRPDAGWVRTWAYLPILLFILLVAIQLLPLPAGAIGAVSPNTLAVKTRLLADLPNANGLLKVMTLSFYPEATRQSLRLILVAAVVFIVTVNVYRQPKQIQGLLGAIAIIGGAVAALALAQDLAAAKGIYWLIPIGNDYRATAGPFVNYNNFAQFMNLSMGAAIGLLLVVVTKADRHGRRSLPQVLGSLDGAEGRLLKAVAAMIVLGSISIFLSGSRGGMISLLVAFCLTALLVGSQRKLAGRGWLLLLLGLAVFVAMLYGGFDTAYNRLSTLHNLEKASGARWADNQDAWAMWPSFPTAGVGLGAHEVVFPMFSRHVTPGLGEHLENDYLQALEETGWAGLGLIGVFISIIGANLWRIIRRGGRSIHAAAFGLSFGLVAVLIHSLSDFGQRLPANACLSAVFSGLLVSLARIGRAPKAAATLPAMAPWPTWRRALPIGGLAIGVLLTGWAIVTEARITAAESYWEQAVRAERPLAEQNWQGSNAQFAELIAHAQAAADAQPGNVQYHHWLNVYRWYSMGRIIDAQGRLVLTEHMLGYARRIADEFNNGRVLCPTYGPGLSMAGQIELFVLRQPVGAAHIRLGYELSPSDPTTCFLAGRLDVKEGRVEESVDKFSRAMKLGHPFHEILDTYLHDADRPDLAVQLVGDDRAALSYLADVFAKSGRNDKLAEQVRQRSVELLKSAAARPEASADVLASMGALLIKERDYPAAAGFYRKALDQDYGNVGWRLSLAQALAGSGQVQQAMHEAHVCLRLRPQMVDAQRLIGELSLRPDASRER